MVRCPQSHPGAGVPSRGLCENALRRPDSLCSLLPFPHHLSQCWHILTSVQTTSFEFTVSQIQGSDLNTSSAHSAFLLVRSLDIRALDLAGSAHFFVTLPPLPLFHISVICFSF
ncbi:hypothetical protein BT96DRAFT_501125 [Gymnopus androsaceus JB14]|uniref:Uncharacterized protein n=1 Tax=Gymnopus androsaceus JB14 TaxID=1447944 RepID=A0A6A4I3C5_9AGAR|nr:hypothetical protein BT96DRAFT_501125 [Gymnopus androsaceus JB14]